MSDKPKIDLLEMGLEEKAINNLEIYITAVASIKYQHQSEFLLRYWGSEVENASELQHAFLGVINKYRRIKDEEEYRNGDNTINFDRLSYAIYKSLKCSYVIKNGDFEGKDKENIIPLPCLKHEFIKFIILTLSEWE